MREDSSTVSWNQVSREWCEMIEQSDPNNPGYFIMPYTLEQLGNVSGKKILDLGCGEGRYSRELAARGANVTAIDCASFSIEYAQSKARENGLQICHYIRNGNDLYDIGDNCFDIVLCSMMLMDCEDLEGTVKEAARVLKPSGRLFVSVLHPCFNGKTSGGWTKGSTGKSLWKTTFPRRNGLNRSQKILRLRSYGGTGHCRTM